MKKKEQENTFINLGKNQILERKEYYISFNPNTNFDDEAVLLNFTGALIGGLIGKEMESDGRSETALCKNGKYYILNGDHRKQYQKLRTFKESMAYFKSKPKLKSGWSN